MINLKELRISKGYTRKYIADYIGMPYRTLENYEQGYRESSEWIIRLIAEKIEQLQAKEEP